MHMILKLSDVTCDLIPLAVLKHPITIPAIIKGFFVTCDLIPLAVLKHPRHRLPIPYLGCHM